MGSSLMIVSFEKEIQLFTNRQSPLKGTCTLTMFADCAPPKVFEVLYMYDMQSYEKRFWYYAK